MTTGFNTGSEIRPPRFAVSLSARDPERLPGFVLPAKARAVSASQARPGGGNSESDRLATLTGQYLSTWFLRAGIDIIPLTLEQRHLLLLQAQLHASRVLMKELRLAGAPPDERLGSLMRRMQRQVHWLSIGVSAQDIAACSEAHPTGDLPDIPPPVSCPPLEHMVAANN